MEQIAEIPPDRIAYADETGIDSYPYRTHGWLKRGKPLAGRISGRKFKRTGIAAAKIRKTIIAPLQYEGTTDSGLFGLRFENCLLPSLPDKSVIVMDNASFHRKKKLLDLAEKEEMRLIFLPPYSPELNPIETFWNWLKCHLCKTLPLYASFDDAICSAFNVC